MGKTENLISAEAIEKIREIAKDEGICMFCTNLDGRPFSATPMSTQKVEADGSIWFFSAKDSDRNAEIKQSPETQLLYSSTSSQEYLSLYGRSTIVYDLDKARELWTPFVKTWFQEGPKDPNLSLIHFRPSDGFYWDTQHGKVVAFAKMAASIVTGNTMDDGVEGKLKL